MANICFDCENAVPDRKGRGCPWSRKFEPVEGWVAPVRYLPNGSKGAALSYDVRECPLFIPSRGAKREHTGMRKPVRCVETGKVYGTYKEAAESVGVNPSAISAAVGEERPCKGLLWESVSPEEYRALTGEV